MGVKAKASARARPARPHPALAQAAAAERQGRHAEAVMLLAALPAEVRTQPEVAHRLAVALARTGRPLDALLQHLAAWQGAPEDRSLRQALAAALARGPLPAAADPALEAAVLALADADDVEVPAPAVLALLAARPAWRAALAAAEAGDAASVVALAARPAPEGLAGDGFVAGAIQRLLLPGEAAERLLAALRRGQLERVLQDGDTLPAADDALLAGLALQAWWSGYCWGESAEEQAAVARLETVLQDAAAGPPALPALCAHLAYRPPTGLPRAWFERGPLAPVGRVCLDEPAAEAALAAALPRLTPVRDAVSCAVQAQYDQNPYPRWRQVRRQAARPLPAVATGLFPWLRAASLPRGADRPRILVAGCGTGAHAVKVASRYRGAQVLAVDLSPRALGFAARKAAEIGLTNLDFAVADLLELGGLAQRFHLIECSGVLHHLDDPLQGWRVLTGLLHPRGLMKLGLYSTAARRDIAELRRWIAAQGLQGDAAGIRAGRAAVLALPPQAPARQVARELDFYSADTCRDLLFHVREVTVTIPLLADWLQRLELEFLGFEIADPALLHRFRRRFPEEAALRDLAAWDRFEAAEPAAFRTMYQFWCRGRGAAGSGYSRGSGGGSARTGPS